MRPVVVIAALVALAGCRQLGVPCVAVEDCAAGDVCIDGDCVTACNVDDDCSGGEACVEGLCSAGDDPPAGEGEGEVPVEGEGEEGEGEGDVGEGEGDVGEGEGEGGEGEGEVGEGEGEGEGDVREGEGEGEPPEDPGAPDPCGALDPFRADLNGDCEPDLAIGAPGVSKIFVIGSEVDGVITQSFAQDWSGDAIVGNAPAAELLGTAIALEPDVGGDDARTFFASLPGVGTVRELVPFERNGQTFDEEFRGTVNVGGEAAGTVMAVSRADDDVGANGTTRILVADATGGGRLSLGGATSGPFLDAIRVVTGAPIRAIVRIADKDGDGEEDFLVGAPGTVQGPLTVGVFAVSSADLSLIDTFRFAMPGGSTSFGAALAVVGDVDGDGRQDIVVGEPDDGRAGRIHLLRSSQQFAATVVDAPVDAADDARFGFAVSPVGDIDRDGKNDIVIGAPFDFAGGAPDDVECDDVAPGPYAGDCPGSVFLLPSTDLVAPSSPAPFACARLFNSGDGTRLARTRLGFSLRALGPHPESRDLGERLAIGGPGTPNPGGDPGIVVVFTFKANVVARTCTSAEPDQTVLVFIGPTALGFGGGDGFGAALGQ